MRVSLLLVILTMPISAKACGTYLLHVGVGAVFGSGDSPRAGVDVGGHCAAQQNVASPMAGTSVRVTLLSESKPAVQGLLSGGVFVPGGTGIQAEVGVLGHARTAVPTVGASVWTAPLGDTSPRLSGGWTHFRRDKAGVDWLAVMVGVSVSDLLTPDYVLLSGK